MVRVHTADRDAIEFEDANYIMEWGEDTSCLAIARTAENTDGDDVVQVYAVFNRWEYAELIEDVDA